MKKSTLIMMLSIVLAVALGIGGTLAYLTDTDADVNTMVLGNVQIVQNEQERVKDEEGNFTSALQPFTNNQTIYPAVYDVKPNDQAKVPLNVNGYEIKIREFPNYVDKMVSVTNTGASDAYVRTIIAVPNALNTDYSDATEGNNVSETWLHWNSITDTDTTPNNGWYAGSDENRTEYPGAENRYIIKDVEINGAMYTVCVFTNMDPLAPGETTGPCMAGFYLDNNVDYEDGNYVWRDKETGKATVVWDKDQIDILVMSQAVQAQGFDHAYDALNAAFGVVDADKAATWLGNITDEDIGSPGDKNEDNNPPMFADIIVTNDEELIAALEGDYKVIGMKAGNYTMPSNTLFSSDVELVCADGVVFEGNSKLNINGATITGATFSNPTGTAVDQTINAILKDCTFTGSNALRWCYAGETVVFENCDFIGDVYGVHFDGGANDVLFKNCTLSGFNATGSQITQLTFEGCTFEPNENCGYNGINLWGNATMTDCTFVFDGTASYEWVDPIKADGEYTFTNCQVDNGTDVVKLTAENAAGFGIESRNNAPITFN